MLEVDASEAKIIETLIVFKVLEQDAHKVWKLPKTTF
jgi:hypothetical protein